AAKLLAGRLERCTDQTITSRAVLEAELAAVRERGFAVIDGELEPGLVAVAAPIHRDGGAVVAALSVSGPGTRLTPPRIADVAAACVAQARGLSQALGHRRDGAAPGRDGPAPRLADTARAPHAAQARREGAACPPTSYSSRCTTTPWWATAPPCL